MCREEHGDREVTENLPVTKNEIREIAGEQGRKYDSEWIVSTSRVIQERVLCLPEFESAGMVCGYLAMGREVRTEMIFEAAWQLGKRICVPAYRAEDGSYGLSELAAGSQLIVGHGGVREPAVPLWVDFKTVDLMIVPGLAFDMRGGRVGRGKGYYDKLLGDMADRSFLTVGLAFRFQVFESVPMESHDVILDAVITEENTAVV